MWKITTHGFTLEEVLILAAMNLLTTADSAAKRERADFADGVLSVMHFEFGGDLETTQSEAA